MPRIAHNPADQEVVDLMLEMARLGLDFDCGTAYIRRSYIDKQEELLARMKKVLDERSVKVPA